MTVGAAVAAWVLAGALVVTARTLRHRGLVALTPMGAALGLFLLVLARGGPESVGLPLLLATFLAGAASLGERAGGDAGEATESSDPSRPRTPQAHHEGGSAVRRWCEHLLRTEGEATERPDVPDAHGTGRAASPRPDSTVGGAPGVLGDRRREVGLLEQALNRAAELDEEERLERERRAQEQRRRAQDGARRHLLGQFQVEPKPETVHDREYWVVDDLVFLVREEYSDRGDPGDPHVTYLVTVVPSASGETTLVGRRCRDLDSLARAVRANRDALVHRDGVLARLAGGGNVVLPSRRHR